MVLHKSFILFGKKSFWKYVPLICFSDVTNETMYSYLTWFVHWCIDLSALSETHLILHHVNLRVSLHPELPTYSCCKQICTIMWLSTKSQGIILSLFGTLSLVLTYYWSFKTLNMTKGFNCNCCPSTWNTEGHWKWKKELYYEFCNRIHKEKLLKLTIHPFQSQSRNHYSNQITEK